MWKGRGNRSARAIGELAFPHKRTTASGASEETSESSAQFFDANLSARILLVRFTSQLGDFSRENGYSAAGTTS